MEWVEYQGVRFLGNAPAGFTHADLIRTWIALQKSENRSAAHKANFWAWEVMHEMVHDNPGYAWRLILDILAADHSDRVMADLSAGPLENLLAQHGAQYIAKVEQQARADPLFARLLGGVWQNAMTDEVWRRVQRAWNRRGWDGIPE
jgi:hypothetical protein